MSGCTSKQQTAEEAAAFWFARLRAENANAGDRRKFERWLKESPRNEEIYAASEAVWEMTQEAATNNEFMEMRRKALGMTPVAAGRSRTRTAALAASVLIAVLSGFLFFPDMAGKLTGNAHVAGQEDALYYRTSVGQRSTVSLADGSTVELNTDSLIEIEFDDAERRIVLNRGQALFDVFKDRTRPFVVEADGNLITAHGTAFDVRRSADKVQVTLLEGEVTVERDGGILPDFGEGEIQTLEPGEQLVAVDKERFEVRKPDIKRVVSWRDGLLIFNNEPLGDVVEEVNRYSLRKVVLGADSMNELRVGGVFRAGSVSSFTSALESAFPLSSRIDESRNFVVLEWSEQPPP